MNQHTDEIIRYYKAMGLLKDKFNMESLPKQLMYGHAEITEAFEAWRVADWVELGRELQT